MDSLLKILEVMKLMPRTGYGEVIIKIEDRKIVFVEKREKIKP